MSTWPRRRATRVPNYDYARNGIYFATMCSYAHEPVFGEVLREQVTLSSIGRIVADEWLRISIVRPAIDLDAYVVMPNHVHGILVFQHPSDRETPQQPMFSSNGGARRRRGTLGSVIAGFKAASTKRVNEQFRIAGAPLWQRNYYEHIVRNEAELDRIRDYIESNPARWSDRIRHTSSREQGDMSTVRAHAVRPYKSPGETPRPWSGEVVL